LPGCEQWPIFSLVSHLTAGQAFEKCCGAKGIRTPDLLHAIQNFIVSQCGWMWLYQRFQSPYVAGRSPASLSACTPSCSPTGLLMHHALGQRALGELKRTFYRIVHSCLALPGQLYHCDGTGQPCHHLVGPTPTALLCSSFLLRIDRFPDSYAGWQGRLRWPGGWRRLERGTLPIRRT
jgi:hypothetical protein